MIEVTYTPTVVESKMVSSVLEVALESKPVIVEIGGVSVTSAGNDTFAVTANETLSALRVVSSRSNGRVGLASKDDLVNAEVLGVTVSAGNEGDEVQVRASGVMTDGSWTWTPGADVFLSTGGQMTQAPVLGAGEFLYKVGTSLTATKLAIGLQFIVEA